MVNIHSQFSEEQLKLNRLKKERDLIRKNQRYRRTSMIWFHLFALLYFLPLSLEIRDKILKNLNGIWNIVLCCKKCNRGKYGKFNHIPDKKFLYKLNDRNNGLIESREPVRYTIMRQTGQSINARKFFLNNSYDIALRSYITTWKPKEYYNETTLSIL